MDLDHAAGLKGLESGLEFPQHTGNTLLMVQDRSSNAVRPVRPCSEHGSMGKPSCSAGHVLPERLVRPGMDESRVIAHLTGTFVQTVLTLGW